ncbi:toxin-antitoxin system YwqK family antitoxin [Seonamhaeicola aphaedonensis]|uniref:MORN repeat protein n=1 Tax=Seonamhaeicola aphaedonensis TaxID=1461338 RepID=A0A3D9HDT4_9FLAO|nr:hypothetical protein [Seonamhaeicola aphaedonensis]RED47633.1 MORN repeat protein [Seonamhaeicola aphaedonensis]
MKSLLSIIFLTFISNLYAQEHKFEYGNEIYMDYHYNCSIDYGYTFKEKLPDGKYIAYSSSNPELILVEAFYKDKRKSGKWKIYNPYEKQTEFNDYENGKLISEKLIDSLGQTLLEIKHINKEQFGDYYNYFDNGQLKRSERFRRHKRKSTQVITEYYKNGNVKSIIRYLNNGANTKPIGKWETYYENGQPKSKKEYGKNWREIGIWKEWNEKGEITSEINKDGK